LPPTLFSGFNILIYKNCFNHRSPRANEFGEHVSKLGRLNNAGVFGMGTPDGPGDDMESTYHYRPGKVDVFSGSESGLSNASIRTLQILGNPFSPPLIDSRSEGWYVSEMGQDFLARYSDARWREDVPSLAHRSLRAAPIYIASAIPDLAALPTDDYLEWRAFLSPSINALTSEIELRLQATRGLDPQDDIDFLTSETSPLDDLYVDLQREIEASTLQKKLTDALPGATFGTMVAGFQSLIAGVPLGTIPAVAIGSLSVFSSDLSQSSVNTLP